MKNNSIAFLITLFFLALLIQPVLADTNVTVDVWSTEPINFYSNLNTTGSVDITIDGTDFNQELNNINNDKISWKDLTYMFDQIAKYFSGSKDSHSTATPLFNSLNSVFVNRADEQLINDKLDNLNMRVMALERTMEQINSTAYCQAKLDLMEEYNLSWVKCGEHSTYYYNIESTQGKSIIGIEAINETIPKPTTANITITSFLVPELKAGENATVKLTIKNSGNATGSASVSLEKPETWPVSPEEANFTLNPAEESTAEFTISVPETAKENYKITGKVSFTFMNEEKQLSEEKDTPVKPIEMSTGKQITGYFSLIASELFPVEKPLTKAYINLIASGITSNIVYQIYFVSATIILLSTIFEINYRNRAEQNNSNKTK